MPKIEVPWINGKRLMERWDINLDELYQAIFFYIYLYIILTMKDKRVLNLKNMTLMAI